MSAVVAVALILVPTVMRAQQRVERHEATALGIRLNWASDAPPPFADHGRNDRRCDSVVPVTLWQQPHPARMILHAFDQPLVQPLVDQSPGLLRGPPAPDSPDVSAFVAV